MAHLANNETLILFRMGDEKAFKELFYLLYSPLCLFAHRYVRDEATAATVVNDCFIKIWGKRKKFLDYPSLRAYLFTSVRNASLTWLSSKKPDVVEFISSKHDLLEPRIGAQDCLAEIEASFIERLPELLLTLSDQQKKIVEQIFFDGKKTSEVADSLNVSVSTVKTQKARTLAKLKKALRQPRQ